MKLELFIIALTYAVAVFEAYMDVKSGPRYLVSNIVRGSLGAIVTIGYAWDFMTGFVTLGFLFFAYLTVFNLSYNLFKGNYIYYLGETSKMDRKFKEVEFGYFCLTWMLHLVFLTAFIHIDSVSW